MSRLKSVRWRFPQAFCCTLHKLRTSVALERRERKFTLTPSVSKRRRHANLAVPVALRVLLRLEYGSSVPIAADPHNAPFVAPREQECDRQKLRGLQRTMLSAAH